MHTRFNNESEVDLRKQLLDLGFRENGTETLYNGLTGERFQVKIFTGNQSSLVFQTRKYVWKPLDLY